MQGEPGLDGIVVVVGTEDAAGRRRTERPGGTINLLGHAQYLPRGDLRRLSGNDQRTGSFGEGRVRGKKGLDAPRAGRAEPWDRGPPLPPARDAHGEISQRLDPCGVQDIDCACRQPARDLVADPRRRKGQRAQQLDGLRHGPGMALTLIGRAFEQCRQVGSLALAGVLGQLPADLPEKPACRLAVAKPIAQVAVGRVPRGSALVPGAQRSERCGVGEAIGDGQVSGHFGGSEFGTGMMA